jgi:uncharacterized OB-fold protein
MNHEHQHSATSPETGADSGELMYVKCASCGKWMDVKPGHLNSISHSLCPACYDQEMRKLPPETED